jgi:hypothetical protein
VRQWLERFGFTDGVVAGLVVASLLFGGLWLAGVGGGGGSGDSAGRAVGAASAALPTTAPTPVEESASPGPATSGEETNPAQGGTVTSSAQPESSAPRAVPRSGELPSGDRVTCPDASITVSDSDALTAALSAAAPGDSIRLADGTYTGSFVAARSGTADKPIFLCGGPGAVIDGGGIKKGYAVHLDHASYWRLVGFTVRDAQKGVMADGASNCVIQGLTVEEIGDEGIHLRAASTHNAVIGNTVRRTGLRRDKFGEGVYVGSAKSNWPQYSGGDADRSDHNLVQGNTISDTSAESIDVKEGTTGGALISNVLDGSGMTGADSLIDVKGNGWLIEGNVGRHAPKDGFQTHRILDGWGSGNVFRDNTIGIDGDGQDVYIHDPEVTDNVVSCNNKTVSGAPLTSNVTCTR